MAQILAHGFTLPPPLAVRPDLTDGDVAWLNAQLALCDEPAVHYTRDLPTPPPPGGQRPPAPTSWIQMTTVRG